MYFIAFRDGLTPPNLAWLQTTGARVDRQFTRINTASVRMSASVLSRVQGNPRIDYIEAVPMRYPSDLSTSQLVPSATNGLYGLVRTQAISAQGAGALGTNVNVGVADTGIDYTHPDIAPNYRGGTDTLDNDNDPFWNHSAEETHATHVAGTLLGVNNSVGIFGVAPSANLYVARVLGPTGGTASQVMGGVQWLVETAHCKVINMSLGGGRYSRTEDQFYALMRSEGAVLVAASGNEGAARIDYPAGYSSVIAVGAVNQSNVKASFSNTGLKLDLVAPGVDVLSSVPIGSGFEASVTSGANSYLAFGAQYAGTTAGITSVLVNCGLAASSSDCPVGSTGKIALIQRGNTSFADKVTAVTNAGAIGAIIYNNESGNLSGATLGTPTMPDSRPWIPTVTTSDQVGATLLSLVNRTVTLLNNTSNWDYYSGTSMAAPHVSGVAALMLSVNPSLPNTSVETILFKTALNLGPRTSYGWGIVNAAAAVSAARN